MSIKVGRPILADLPGCPTPGEIKAKRLEAGISQEEAARRAGVVVSTWRRWERGTNGMPRAIWDDWRKWLSVSASAAEPAPPTRAEIRAERLMRGLTQERAARIARVSVTTWRAWETGTATMHGAKWREWYAA